MPKAYRHSERPNFHLKMRVKHMAVGLRPDPLVELERSLRSLAAVAVVVELIIPSDYLVDDRDNREKLEVKSDE